MSDVRKTPTTDNTIKNHTRSTAFEWLYDPRCEKTGFWGFLTCSDTNRAVQSQKMARGLKLRNLEVEGLYYLCSENKGADQLRGYRCVTG